MENIPLQNVQAEIFDKKFTLKVFVPENVPYGTKLSRSAHEGKMMDKCNHAHNSIEQWSYSAALGLYSRMQRYTNLTW